MHHDTAMAYNILYTLFILMVLASLAEAEPVVPSNGTVFAMSLQIPSLAAEAYIPAPRDIINPLKAARMSHWRCRYRNGRLAEVSRRDYLGTYRPMRPPPDGAPTNGYLFHYSPDTAQIPDRITTPEGIVYNLFYSPSNFLTDIVCSNISLKHKKPYSKISIHRNPACLVTRISFWNGNIPAKNYDGVHARTFRYNTNGFLKEVQYVDSSSNICNNSSGIAQKAYRRGGEGEWLGISFWNENGSPTTDWHGVSRYEITYNDALRFKTTALFGPGDTPAVNALGGHKLIWQYDSLFNLIGTVAVDADGNTVFDGIPLMPELFYRTWPEALITREQRELAVPIWEFMDYSELVNALQRWHNHKIARRGVNQLQLEQLRILADYLISSRAGITAITAALLCQAHGLADPRRLKNAILSAGCMPAPDTPAAGFLLDEVTAGIQTGSFLITMHDPSRLLLEFNIFTGTIDDRIILLPFDNIGDSIYIDALKTLFSGHEDIWLPSALTVRNALQAYAVMLNRRESQSDISHLFFIEKDRIALRGSENVTEIKKIILDEMLRNTSNRIIYAEAIPGDTSLFSRMIPAGPVFQLYAGKSQQDSGMYSAAVQDYWYALSNRLNTLSAGPDTYACRRYFSRAAAAQAEWLYYHRQTNEAAAVFRTAIDICPTTPEPYLQLGEKLIAQERFDEAERVLEELLTVNAGENRADELILYLSEARQRVQRIRHLELIGAASHTLCTSNVMTLAELYTAQNRPARAAELAGVLFANSSNCVQTLEWLVNFYAANRMLDDAAECLARLTRLEPDSFDHWSSRAAIAYERNRPDEGLRHIARAAEIDKFRLRRMLTAGNFLQELLKDGNTNLVNQLEQLIRIE